MRATHRRTVLEGAVPDLAASEIADGQQRVVRRHGNAVREQPAVHHLAQHAVAGILINGAGLVGEVRPRAGAPRIGKEQVPLGVEIEVVGPFEQLVAVGVDQRLEFFGRRIIEQDPAVAGGQVELAVEPAGALRLAGLTQLGRRVAVEHRDELAIRRQIRDPAAADRHEP